MSRELNVGNLYSSCLAPGIFQIGSVCWLLLFGLVFFVAFVVGVGFLG